MDRRTFFSVVIAVPLALAGMEASAHQQKAAVTEILFNPRTGNLEVAHRFSMHDAEHALRTELGIDGDLYASSDTQSDFASYVAERFAIADPEGSILPLNVLGTEISGGYFWVYQETPAPDGVGFLSVRHDALRDVWPNQVNRVNVKHRGEVRTLVFTGAADWLVAVLAE